MTNRDDRIVEFRLEPEAHGFAPGMENAGELVLMRVSAILCLFPEHRQIRTIGSGWTLNVCEEDWPRVERAFGSAYLGMPVHVTGSSVLND